MAFFVMHWCTTKNWRTTENSLIAKIHDTLQKKKLVPETCKLVPETTNKNHCYFRRRPRWTKIAFKLGLANWYNVQVYLPINSMKSNFEWSNDIHISCYFEINAILVLSVKFHIRTIWLHYIKSLLYVGVAMLTGGQCRQKCLFGCIWLIQSRLIELGARLHAVLV